MTENHQIELLQRWLQSKPGVGPSGGARGEGRGEGRGEDGGPTAGGPLDEAPAALDPDLRYAVLALRPDLAPPPRLSVDDILDSVSEGPFAVDPGEAAAVQGWIDGADDLPEGLDDDVVEALYALRPDRAPAPTIDLDALLDEVQEGPFAPRLAKVLPFSAAPAALDKATPKAERAELPGASGERAPVVELSSRRRLPTWLMPALGVLAAAASVLLVVGPMHDEAPPMSAPAPVQDAGVPMAPHAAPSEEALGTVSQSGAAVAGLEEGGKTSPDPAAASPAVPAAAEPPSPPTKASAGPSDAAGVVAATTPTALPSPSADAPPSAEAEPSELANTGGLAGGAVGGADLDDNTASNTAANTASNTAANTADAYFADEADQARSGGRSKSDSVVAGEGRSAKQEEAKKKSDEKRPEEEVASREERAYDAAREDEAPLAKKPSKASSRAPAPAAAPPPEPARAAPSGASSASLDDLRRQASPASRGPDLAARHPELQATYEEINAATRAGATSKVVGLCNTLRGHSDPDVAMDAAWRSARITLAAGQADQALAHIARGLELSGAPFFRARLLALKGEALEARGDAAGARQAYEQAARAR